MQSNRPQQTKAPGPQRWVNNALKTQNFKWLTNLVLYIKDHRIALHSTFNIFQLNYF